MGVALEMREKGAARNDLFDRFAADERLGSSESVAVVGIIAAILYDPSWWNDFQ